MHFSFVRELSSWPRLTRSPPVRQLLCIGVISSHHPPSMWPLWVGPLIMIGSPTTVAALHIPILVLIPCMLFVDDWRARRPRRIIIDVETAGRIANQAHMGTVNAQAAPPALELAVVRREERDVTGAEAEAPAIDRKENDIPPCDRNAPKDGLSRATSQNPRRLKPQHHHLAMILARFPLPPTSGLSSQNPRHRTVRRAYSI